jgi:Transcriptional regulator/sugar kinase
MKNDSRSLVRVANRQLVLQQLFNHPATTRVDIARELKINKSTVSAIYNELNDEGFIEELGQGESTNRGGRKPNLVCLNKRYGFVASFEIGTGHLRVMFSYINGEIISYEQIALEKRDMLLIMQTIKEVLQKMEQNDDTIHGLLAIGFSVHGIVDHNQIVDAPFISTNGIDLAAYFENEFHVPTILENEANLAAIFERDFGDRESYRDLLASAFIVASVPESLPISSCIAAFMVELAKLAAVWSLVRMDSWSKLRHSALKMQF